MFPTPPGFSRCHEGVRCGSSSHSFMAAGVAAMLAPQPSYHSLESDRTPTLVMFEANGGAVGDPETTVWIS